MAGMDPADMMAMMGPGLWESPMVTQIAFHPRTEDAQHDSGSGPVRDGTFSVSDGDKVAYRLYLPSDPEKAALVVLHFHGNAELCSESGPQAAFLNEKGAALLSIDYRGYAWGTGQPGLGKLCPDADACFEQCAAVLEAAGVPKSHKKVCWGRSIGATCAVHLAATKAAAVHGLVVDSGLMDLRSLPMVAMMASQFLGPQGGGMLSMLPDPVGTLDKLPAIGCPCLVMHGNTDEIVPLAQANVCYERLGTPPPTKTLHTCPTAGHNDLMPCMGSEWPRLVDNLLTLAAAFHSAFPAGAQVEAHSLSAQQFNGLRGKVLGPKGEERFRVQLDGEGEKALKPANLKIV